MRDISKYATNKIEEVALKYKVDGWEIVRRGWPDFMIYKNGEIRFVYVKKKSRSGIDRTPIHKNRGCNILKQSGLKVDVVYIP